MVVLALHGEVAKALLAAKLARHKLLVSNDAVVGLALFARTLAKNTSQLLC